MAESNHNADISSISAVLSGDLDAFRDLVKRYESQIQRLTYRYLGDRDEMMDATQETFLRAYRALSSYNSAYAFSTWLDRIAVNVCRTRYKRSRRRQDRESDEPDQERLADRSEPVEIAVERRETERAVRSAVDSLPAKLRDPVILYYLEERTVDDVASILALSRENVKSRLHRARKKLAAILGDDATTGDDR